MYRSRNVDVIKFQSSPTDFRKKSLILNFVKIRPVGAELFHADGRTDMKLIAAFRNFVNAPKNGSRRKGVEKNKEE